MPTLPFSRTNPQNFMLFPLLVAAAAGTFDIVDVDALSRFDIL